MYVNPQHLETNFLIICTEFFKKRPNSLPCCSAEGAVCSRITAFLAELCQMCSNAFVSIWEGFKSGFSNSRYFDIQ